MPIFSPNRMASVENALRNRANRFFSTMPLLLSPSDFVDAYIKPEHIAPLNQVRELVGDLGSWYTATTVKIPDGVFKAMINFKGKAPIILPQYIATGFRDDAPMSIVDRVTMWAQERFQFGALMGDAIDGLLYLNNNSSDIRAMRAMFPSLPLLLKDISEDDKSYTTKLAMKLDNNKTVINLPRLPREVSQRLLEASNVISSTTLFDGVLTVDDKDRAPGSALFSRDTSYMVKRPNIFYEGNSGTFL